MQSNKAEIIEFLKREFPQSLLKCEIESVVEGGASIIYHIDAQDLRPGGTVSGPTMMTAADYAELEAQMRDPSQHPPQVAQRYRDLVTLLRLRRAIRSVFPFLLR